MAQPSTASNRSTRECIRLIREECLQQRPDVIALQESTHPLLGSDMFDDYTSMGVQQSHCGYVDLLLHNDLVSNCEPIELDPRLPSVAASLTLPSKIKVALSSSHLAPFKDGFPQRAHQFNSLASSLMHECNNCIFLGDFNMRAAEDQYMENLCGGLVDAWKLCGSDPSSKFTWDSFAK